MPGHGGMGTGADQGLHLFNGGRSHVLEGVMLSS